MRVNLRGKILLTILSMFMIWAVLYNHLYLVMLSFGAVLMLFTYFYHIKPINKAFREVSSALLRDDFREHLEKESDAYELFLELFEDGSICESMTTDELDKFLSREHKDRYAELNLWYYFGEISTNPDRFKKRTKVVITNYRVFPRTTLEFAIRDKKIFKIEENVDAGNS